MVYEQSLVLLCRLLVILYAESRNILPVRENAAYASTASLETIKLDLRRVSTTRFSRDGTDYYTRLKDLFFRIDAGDPELALPAYQWPGFSDEQFPFLAQK